MAMVSEYRRLLPALSRPYAGRKVGNIAEPTDASFGDFLVEVGRQGHRLPPFTSAKMPTLRAMFDSLLARGAESNTDLRTPDRHLR